MFGFLSGLVSTSSYFSGEDPIVGKPWYHAEMTWKAAELAGWATGGGPKDNSSAAAALAWHADFVDSYNYNPLWWAEGGFDRFHVSLLHHDQLNKLHFDDLTSIRQVKLVWARYLAGTVAGLLWAAERQDVAAARNVVGSALHALQDFYSHSNWVDEPARRNTCWRSFAQTIIASPGDPRDALHLYSGTYGLPDQAGFKPHGKIAFDCSVLKLLPAALMDVACAAISPLSNTSLCQRWRDCKGSVSTPIGKVLGVPIPPGIVYMEPPGIALDAKWTAEIARQVRDLPDRSTITGKALFDAAYNLAVEHTRIWLTDLEVIMQRARQQQFWQRVKNEPRSGPQRVTTITQLADMVPAYQSDLAQYEAPWQMPFTFASAGCYPPNPEGSDEGWFLRVEITTANDFYADTNADISAEAAGVSFPLDHMHERKPDGGIGENRLLEWNDFEQGSHDTYIIGPCKALPTQIVLRNRADDIGDILEGAWNDLRIWASDTLKSLGDALLALVGGHADYISGDKVTYNWQQLTSLVAAGSGIFTLRADGGDQGIYRVTGLIGARPVGDGIRVGVAATTLFCERESAWDRGSSSDEPFVLLVANSPSNRDITSRTVGPLSDVDTGDVIRLEHSGDGHWWLTNFDSNGRMRFVDVGDTGRFGDLTRGAIRFFTGDFSGDGKADLLFYCANDGNWWLGRSTGTTLEWGKVSNTSGFGDLTRPAIRFFTGDFTGDGKTDVLFYCANDGAWWLGRSTGTTLEWSNAGNTSGFGDLTRGAIRFFTGDFSGDGKTDILFYCANDGAWWLGRSTGTTLEWGNVSNTRGFGDLTRPAIRFFTGDFSGDGKTDVLFYCANDGNWFLGRSTGSTLEWVSAGNTSGFGDLTRGAIRFFTGDFSGDGKTDVLFYCANDGNWFLGRSTGTTLEWSLAGNTRGFGDLTRGDIMFFDPADATGDGRADILFYCAGDGNWHLGRSTGSTLQWSLAGNTSQFGDLRRGSARILSGDFTGDRRRDLLIHIPMLSVTVPRYGGLIVPAQVWESDLEAQHERDTLERNFRNGYDPETLDERSAFLDAMGKAIAPDWKIATLDVYAFRRAAVVEVAHPVRNRALNLWIKGNSALTIPFDPPAVTQISLEVPPALATPQLSSPPDGSQFNHYPRTTTLGWKPVTGAGKYLVEVQYAWPSPQGQAWGLAHRNEVTTTTDTFSFVGAQPGRWRITALDPTGARAASPPSPWWCFTYSR